MKPRFFLDSDVVNLDYETTDLNALKGRVFSMSLTWVEDGYTEVWRKDGEVRFYNGDEKEIWRGKGNFNQRLKSFCQSPCEAVTHNLMFEWDFSITEGLKFHPRKKFHDTMIMSQYVDNLCPLHKLDYLFNRFHGKVEWIQRADSDVAKAAKIYGTYDKIPKELMFPYQLADGVRGALLYKMFWPLTEPKSEYWNEIELIKTTVDMKRRGFFINKKETNKLIDHLTKELDENDSTIRKILGRYVNVSSKPQLDRLLYDELKFPRGESNDKFAIEKLRLVSNHPILDCILKRRSYITGRTVVKNYLELSDENSLVHANIGTNFDTTGRENCREPNFQNVQKEIKAGARFTVPARRCQGPRPGFILLLADYAGIEIRLAIQGTEDERLIKMCVEGYDFHAACALSFYGDRYTNEKNADLKAALRSRAKNARFAMLYGAGLEQTAATLGLTVEETRAGYERDKSDFPEFYELMAKCTHDARHDGYITTFFGRKLRVPLDRPYAATDYLIQGSAAALFKHAQNEVHCLFKSHWKNDAFIIIPVHDELVMEVRRGVDLSLLTAQVQRIMTSFNEIKVKLDVEFSIATYIWSNKVKYELSR
jgi:DNA polymerase-1